MAVLIAYYKSKSTINNELMREHGEGNLSIKLFFNTTY